MKLIKYIFLLLTFLGLFQTKLEAKPVILANCKMEFFAEYSFLEESAEKEWLGLLYLQEESTHQNQKPFLQFSLGSLIQNFSGEVCQKSTSNNLELCFQVGENSKSHQESYGWNKEVFYGNLDLVNAWSVIKNSGDDDLAKLATNLDELDLVSKNLDEIEAAGGYKAWRGNIEGISKRNVRTLSGEEIIKVVREGSTTITSKSVIAKNLDAASANQQFTGQQIQRFGMSVDLSKVNPPHANIPGVGVNDFKLLENKYFVRVSNSSNNSAGEWLMSLEDFKKFNSPTDIKNGLALPSEPTHFNIAQIPEGTIIRESQAAKVWQEGSYWGNGGTKQYQIQNFHSMEKNTTDSWFSVSKSLSDIF